LDEGFDVVYRVAISPEGAFVVHGDPEKQ
jgi:hypothetical protein